jgi:caffeoyl-CoA O-methyltransferase
MADDSSRAGVRYISHEIIAHVDQLHAPHDGALQAAFATPEQAGMPAIMVSPSEGRLLELLLRMVGASRVVEVGTLAGYSAIRMARALPSDGKIWSVEADPRHAEVAIRNVAAAGLDEQIEVVTGKAFDVLPTLEQHGPFDAVFLDADKEHYDRYAEWALQNLRPRGLLLGDNAFFFGKLLDESPGAVAMRRFHELLRDHCDSVCIPTPDGLALGIKRGA